MPSKILTAALIPQAVLFYGLSCGEPPVHVRPLSEFPRQVGEWEMQRDNIMDEDVKEALRADDYLARGYSALRGRTMGLFVAFFKSQRAGQTPHSPKNCLAGSGWMWSVSDTVAVPIPGRVAPVEVNR
jgi:EpsI family protein